MTLWPGNNEDTLWPQMLHPVPESRTVPIRMSIKGTKMCTCRQGIIGRAVQSKAPVLLGFVDTLVLSTGRVCLNRKFVHLDLSSHHDS